MRFAGVVGQSSGGKWSWGVFAVCQVIIYSLTIPLFDHRARPSHDCGEGFAPSDVFIWAVLAALLRLSTLPFDRFALVLYPNLLFSCILQFACLKRLIPRASGFGYFGRAYCVL